MSLSLVILAWGGGGEEGRGRRDGGGEGRGHLLELFEAT